MISSLTTLGIAITAFAVTNVDDIFILMAFFANPRFKAREIVVGQFVGIGALTVISLVLALAAMAFPPQYVRLLGLLPLCLGLKAVWKLRKDGEEDADESETQSKQSSNALAVAAVTFANGGDNVGVYVPLFSTRPISQLAVIVAAFALMTALWCFMGHYLVNHPRLGRPIRKYGHVGLPVALIAIGIIILLGL